jgi:DNA invertase Pin-like site-specific DNA recombinase
MATIKRKIRCAIYTRKSHEDGLEQEFNSLDAQYEACTAYIQSQRSEGWMMLPDRYDDGGFSGGNIERPALKRLLKDIDNGLVDVIIVYKIDRMSRSLYDFVKLMDAFEKRGVTFVSVTQHFNTTTPMGKLTLNILLSFAQFEREITGERIRDKLAASKKKGMWMGGTPPLGYDVKDRKLVVNEQEAEMIRHIFQRFAVLQSITTLVAEIRERGFRTKTYTSKTERVREGRLMDKGFVYRLLNNRLYLG